MSIVVTGGAGFIGHHVVTRLCDTAEAWGITPEQPVVVLDSLVRGSRTALARQLDSRLARLIEGDIRDEATVRDALRGAEIVFHLAAQSNVMGAERDPEFALSTNVDGTQRVLEVALAEGTQRVVFTSSREVYGQPEQVPVSEHAPIAPKNVYGTSKAAGELCCRAAAAHGSLDVVALRLSNVYGSGDVGRVIPIWLDRAARGEDLIAYGGEQVLDLVWVGDVVEALLRAARLHRGRLAGMGTTGAQRAGNGSFAAINVGSGRGTSLQALAQCICTLVDRDVQVRSEPARAAEVERYVADITLLARTLDLRPDPTLSHLPAMAREAQRRVAAATIASATVAQHTP